jgi:urease accessory protein
MTRLIPALLAAWLAATPALAHTGAGATHGFLAGFGHPFLGLDHLLAMGAVGLWAGLVGGRALWAWPLAFAGVMIVGAALGLQGVALPGVELGIAASVVLLGLAAALRAPLPVLAGAGLCGLFALLHGHAHGAELPAGAGAGAYVAGFVLATAALHGAGIGLGWLAGRGAPAWLPRLAGGAVTAAGLVLLVA